MQRFLPLLAATISALACGGSPAEPPIDDTGPAIAQLALTVSSTLAVGRTVRPIVGAYQSLFAGSGAPTGYYYPADSGMTPVLSSSNAGVVRVNADGTVTAVAAGNAYVSAAVRTKRDSVLVSVIPGYDVTLLANTDSVRLVDVNDAGDVAGSIFPDYTIYTTPGNTGVFIHGGQRIAIGNCYPAALNNAGQIGCNPYGPGGRNGSHPGIYANGAISFPFDADSSGLTGVVTGITESGHIYGMYDNGFVATPLGTFVGGSSGMDYRGPRVNGTGRINSLLHGVALSGPACMYCQALIVRPEGPMALGTLGRYADAHDINDADDVIGSGEDFSIHASRPLLWRKSNQWKAETFSPRVTGLSAISERDQIVGTSADGVFVWEGGRYAFLADAVRDGGWTFTPPLAISRSGIVAARGEHPTLGHGIVLIRLP